MKKILLTLACLVIGIANMQAETLFTLLFGTAYNSEEVNNYTTTWSSTNEGTMWYIGNFNNNKNGWSFVRTGSKSRETVATIINAQAWDYAIDEIVISAKKNKTGQDDKVSSAKIQVLESATSETPLSEVDITQTINSLTTTVQDISFSISGVTNAYYRIVFDLPTASNNGWLEIHSVVYNGERGVAPAVKSPRLSLAETAEGYAVEMTCETEGAEIYYTTSTEDMPADPTDASAKYAAPVDVWMTTYFKAVAYLNGEASSVSTFTAEPPYVLENFMPLTDFEGDAQIDVRGNITAVYQNGDNLWVADEYNNGMLMYGTSTQTLNNGDVIDGLKGKFTLYNGQPEITNYTLGAITSGTPVEPIDITLDELGSYILNRYVKLTGITIANDSGYKYTMTDADGNTGIIYNRYGNASKYTEVTVPEGENFTVIGFVGKNYDDIQLIPVSVTGGEVMEQVSTPVITPETGILEAGAEITISCDTEGATIYYTTDGSTPDAEATEYDGAISFSESMTLKAIAVKEGMLDSEVVTASFTLYDPNGPQIYTFDFTDPAKYGITLPAAASGTELCEKGGSVTYTEGLVSLTFSCDESTQNVPRVWGKNNNGETVYDVRVYAGATVKFATSDENYKIQKIVFTQNTNATDWGASNTYLPDTFNKTDLTWNGEADALPSESFTMVPGAKTFFATAQVYLSQPTGVDTIDSDSDGAIVYYNLQGVRVANPENGLYIVVKGEKSSKVLFSK